MTCHYFDKSINGLDINLTNLFRLRFANIKKDYIPSFKGNIIDTIAN